MSDYYNQQDSFSKKKLKSSYTSMVVSLSLLLFMLGIFGLSVIKTNQVLDYVKENFTFSIVLSEDANELDIMLLEKELKLRPEVKSIKYIKKEDAVATLQKDLGIDFMSFLDSNPLFNSYDINLKSDYVNDDGIKSLEEFFQNRDVISEIVYDDIFIKSISRNMKNIGFGVLIANLFFLIVCVVLIKNSIKLALYSNRFTIKTMQLVGASERFISRPFIRKNILFGILSSTITIIVISILSFFIENRFPDIFGNDNYLTLAGLSIFLVLFSIVITYFTTYLSINKFLNKKVEHLYS